MTLHLMVVVIPIQNMNPLPRSRLSQIANLRARRRSAQVDGFDGSGLPAAGNGPAHFRGVGLVCYGAEREAQPAQILATDPDQLAGSGEPEAGLVVLTE